MIDLKIISIDDDNNIELTGGHMDGSLTQREAAVQYLVTTLMNTPGTMVDDTGFGGGAGILVNKLRQRMQDTTENVAEVIHQTNMSISGKTPDFGPWTIENIILEDVTRDAPRGYTVTIRVDFEEAFSEQFSIEGQGNVNI